MRQDDRYVLASMRARVEANLLTCGLQTIAITIYQYLSATTLLLYGSIPAIILLCL